MDGTLVETMGLLVADSGDEGVSSSLRLVVPLFAQTSSL